MMIGEKGCWYVRFLTRTWQQTANARHEIAGVIIRRPFKIRMIQFSIRRPFKLKTVVFGIQKL